MRRFRRFAEFTLDLTPGLNVIYGPNEAGKSTLHDALLAGLFHKPSSRSAEVIRHQSWQGAGLPQITVEFESDGQGYALAKDFEEKSVALTNLSSGQVLTDWSSVDSAVEEATGLKSALLFKATAFVGQGELEAIALERDLKKGIGDELQKVVTGGGEDVLASAVVKKLDDKIAQLQKGLQALAKEPGDIRAAKDKLLEFEMRIATGKEALAKVERAEEALKDNSERLAAMKQGLADRRGLRARCERRQQLKQSFEELRQKEDELDKRVNQAKELESQITRLGSEMAGYGPVAEINSTVLGRLAGLEEAVKLWQRNIEDEAREIAKLEKRMAEAAGSVGKPWLLLLSLGLIAAGLVGSLVGVDYLLMASVFGAVLALLHLGFRRSASASYADPIRSARGRWHYAQNRLDETEKERQTTLQRFSRPTYQKVLRDYEAYQALARRRGELRARFDGVLSGQTVEQVESARREISRQRRDKEEALGGPELVASDLSPLSFQRLIKEIEGLEAAITELQKETAKNQAIVDTSPVSLVDVYRLEEEQFFWQSQLAAAERRLALCKLTRAAVEEAKNGVLTSAKGALESEMGGYLETITGGRYREVSVDSETLNFSVHSVEKGDGSGMDPRASLSRGAQDQIYLAARLSLVKLICGGKKPPLFLDDPFVAFDEARLESTMSLCRRLAQEHQILLFTCNPAYRKWADNFVTLPAP